MADLIRSQLQIPALSVNGFDTFAGVVGSLYNKTTGMVRTTAYRST